MCLSAHQRANAMYRNATTADGAVEPGVDATLYKDLPRARHIAKGITITA